MRTTGSTPARPERRTLGALRAAAGYAAAEAAAAFRRNGLMSAAAVSTIMAALLPVGAAVALGANLRVVVAAMEEQVQVVAYLQDGVDRTARQRLVARIRTLPGVRRVAFVARDEALRRLQAALGEGVSLRDVVETNPLPDSLEVALLDPRQAREVAAAVRTLPGGEDVTYGAQAVDRLLALTALLRAAGASAAALLGGVAAIIIMNTIRLTIIARRQEIEIMQLVGASPWYVRSPFVLEGALQGLAATALASLMLVAGYLVLLDRVRQTLPFLPLARPSEVLPATVLALSLGGVLVGVGGSTLALRRYLQV